MLRRLIRTRPLNAILTGGTRSVLRALGINSDLARRKLRRFGNVEEPLANGRVLRMWTEDDDLIPNEVFWLGVRNVEPGTVPLFLKLASSSLLTLDVGAHVGLFSLLAAHANPAGRVISFEPMQATFERLLRNIAINKLSNVQAIRSAVADFDGEAEFFTNTALPLCAEASLWRDNVAKFERFTRQSQIQKLRVPVLSLDRFVKSRDLIGIQLIKMDAEGSEPAVLRGMRETLERDRPAIICEVVRGFDTERALEDSLKPLGYIFYLLTPQGLEQRSSIESQPNDRWELRNYLFSPRVLVE